MINQLTYFLKVAEYEHFRKAADELYISQPSLSTSVKRLEQTLDVKLFEQDGRNVRLTEVGKLLIPIARSIVDKYGEMQNTINAYKRSATNQIHVGTAIRHSVVSLDEYSRVNPENKLMLLQFFKYDDLRESLMNQQLGFCICSPPVSGPGIVVEDLIDEPLCVLLNKTHPLASRKELSLKETTDENALTHPEGFPFRRVLDRVYEEVGCRQPQYSCIAENAALFLMLLTEKGKEYILINPVSRCKEAVEMYDAFTYVRLSEEACYRPIGVSWLEKRPPREEARRFIDFLHEFYSKEKYHLDM